MYFKCFSDIIQSSLWAEDAETCKVWITMLALANQDGVVRATAPGLSHEARVPLDRTIEILKLLESPDPHSRTPDNEGRRIERTDGGYLILNYLKYRSLHDDDTRRANDRERQRRHREANRLSRPVTTRHARSQKIPQAEAEAEADADAETTKTPPNPPKGGKADSVPRAFLDFWLLYPRKIGKKAALRAWREAKIDDEQAEKILVAVKAQKTWPQWTKDGGKYICHPRTWLNQGRWDDAPDPSGPLRPGTCSYPVEEAHGL